MLCDLSPDNYCVCPYDFKLETPGEDQIYPQGGPHLNPVMKADHHPSLADIGGDPHVDIAIAGDTVDGEITVESGVFSALSETRSQAK
jgi:hypothetical protein